MFCNSVIQHTAKPVSITALSNIIQSDGSNTFTLSRYLVPSLMGFKGWAVFADGDMVITRDIHELLAHADDTKAVCVVKHAYKTRSKRKYIGSDLECPNPDYPKKNWSSVVLWNCAHPKNALLTEDYVKMCAPSFLHRFSWLQPEEIGELPSDWNYLVDEVAPSNAHLYHYTLGVPGLKHYADCRNSWHWHRGLMGMLECAGEDATQMVKRSEERVGQERLSAVR